MTKLIDKLMKTDNVGMELTYLITYIALFFTYFTYDSLGGMDKTIMHFIWLMAFTPYVVLPILLNGGYATIKFVRAVDNGEISLATALDTKLGMYFFVSNWLVIFMFVPYITLMISYYFGNPYPLYFPR